MFRKKLGILCLMAALLPVSHTVHAASEKAPQALPVYQCAENGRSREMLVQCTIERPVEEEALTALSQEVYTKFQGNPSGIFIIEWDYEVEHKDGLPWGVATFVGDRLDSVKIRRLRNKHAVSYVIYQKTLKINE
ncbi:MAG: hypothetical protein IKO41_06395 [Lachnospiraceae bacterium]|nr:hypothetical protein [Lachnospiraceae bacterium]